MYEDETLRVLRNLAKEFKVEFDIELADLEKDVLIPGYKDGRREEVVSYNYNGPRNFQEINLIGHKDVLVPIFRSPINEKKDILSIGCNPPRDGSKIPYLIELASYDLILAVDCDNFGPILRVEIDSKARLIDRCALDMEGLFGESTTLISMLYDDEPIVAGLDLRVGADFRPVARRFFEFYTRK